MRRAGDLAASSGNKFPKKYRNREADGPRFDEWENRTKQFYEVPTGANPRFDQNRRPTGFDRIQAIENNLHRNDRRTVARDPPNDPGIYRAIANGPPGGDYNHSGLIYHPEGNLNGFVRAPMEPLNRRGRQHLNRYVDDFDGDKNRSVTWPNREEDACAYASREQRYTVEGRANNRQPRNGRRI